MIVQKYRLYCEDEAGFVYVLAKDSDPAPSLCPNNTSHVIRADSVAVDEQYEAQKEVVTQFEKNDKDLKLISATVQVDSQTGIAELLIPCPESGRWIDEGVAFFTEMEPHRIQSIDAITPPGGLPADALYPGSPELPEGYSLKAYHDDEADEALQGWRIPANNGFALAGHITVDTMAGYGWVPGGIVLRIRGKMSGTAPFAGWYTCNIKWGKQG